jgi:hypothetical protein
MFGEKSIDYEFYSNSDGYFAHTSGTFFRNVFTQLEIDQIKQYINTELETCFRADSFRNFYHLRKGKAHYEPKIESVYTFYNGIYSSLRVQERNILNLKFFYKMFVYFKQENAAFFLNLCWFFLLRIIFSSYKEEEIVQLIDVSDLIEIFE